MPVLSDRILRRLAWFLVGVYILLAVTGVFLMLLAGPGSGNGEVPIIAWILQLVVVGIYPVTGALIINRHPRHPVGWLLFATFPVVAVSVFTMGYAKYATSPVSGSLPIPRVIYIWLAGIGEPIALVAFTWLNLLFPTGRLLSPRWRIVGWAAVAALLVFLALQNLRPGPLWQFSELDNPYAAAKPLWAALEPFYFITIAILLLCGLASLICLFVRLRRSRGDERQQVKWLVLPALIYWLCQPFAYILRGNITGGAIYAGVILMIFISVPLIVIAVAAAIFRYRLYDIDLIIRRTVVYGALTAALVLVYYASVLFLQNLVQRFTGQEQSPLVIVVSTLLIAALFNPLRHRIQNDIDRRFYRSRYDAERTLEAFAAELRQEVNLDQVSRSLLAAAARTMQPERASLWLKEEAGERLSTPVQLNQEASHELPG